MLDFNLFLIKLGCALLPQEYVAMVESALRGVLAADKAMLFLEADMAVGALWTAVRLTFSSGARRSAPKR